MNIIFHKSNAFLSDSISEYLAEDGSAASFLPSLIAAIDAKKGADQQVKAYIDRVFFFIN